MRRKAYIVGVLGLGLAATAGHTVPALGRFVSSTLNLRHYISDSRATGGALSPIERFVLSLVLTEAKAPGTCDQAAAPQRRT